MRTRKLLVVVLLAAFVAGVGLAAGVAFSRAASHMLHTHSYFPSQGTEADYSRLIDKGTGQ